MPERERPSDARERERPREGEAQRSAVASHQGLWTRHDMAERERPSEAREGEAKRLLQCRLQLSRMEVFILLLRPSLSLRPMVFFILLSIYRYAPYSPLLCVSTQDASQGSDTGASCDPR